MSLVERVPRPDGLNAAAQVLHVIEVQMRQFTRMLVSPIGVPLDKFADAVVFLGRKTQKHFSDAAAEGVAGYAARNADGVAHLDELHDSIKAASGGLQSVADDSLESIGEAVGRAYKRNLPGSPSADPVAFDRVGEAVAAARRGLEPEYRSVIGAFVGPDHVIKSMEEFEALRFMRADDLRPEQIVAMRTIRESLGGISEGTRVAKVVPLTGQFNAINLVETGNPNLAGSFARASDLADATRTAQLIDRLRLDAPPFHFQAGSPHAIIETTANSAIAASTRYPRTGAFRGHALDDPNPPDFVYPFTGNGLTASRDGRIVPEFRTAGAEAVRMPTGLSAKDGLPITTMKFRFDNGTPYPQTIDIDGVPVTASDWGLTQIGPDEYTWVPIP